MNMVLKSTLVFYLFLVLLQHVQLVDCRNFQEIGVKCPLVDAPRIASRIECVLICARKDKAVVYADGMCYCEDKNTCSLENKQNEVDDGEKNSTLIHPVPSKKSISLTLVLKHQMIELLCTSL